MSWPKQRPMDWNWFQDRIAPNDVAATFAKLVKARQLVKHVIALPDGDILIVSCRGTVKVKAKKKSAADAAKGE